MRRLIDTFRAWHRGLRCRPGDVCLVKDNLGRPDLLPGVVMVRAGSVVQVARLKGLDLWMLADPVDFGTGRVVGIADCFLTPLRDNPGEDETLRIAGKPEPIKAPTKVGKPDKVEA